MSAISSRVIHEGDVVRLENFRVMSVGDVRTNEKSQAPQRFLFVTSLDNKHTASVIVTDDFIQKYEAVKDSIAKDKRTRPIQTFEGTRWNASKANFGVIAKSITQRCAV